MSKRQTRSEPPAPDPAQEFRDAVRDVRRLPNPGRVVHTNKPRAPLPLQRLEDDRQVLRDSLSDEAQHDLELESGDTLAFTRSGLSRQVLRKLRSGYWATQDQLDLHGSRSNAARTLLVAFLAQAVKRGHRCVLVVHGKGTHSEHGAPLREAVLDELLGELSGLVHALSTAAAPDGGEGATYVVLRGRR